MPAFGKSSRIKLGTCDERIQRVLNKAIERVDFRVLCGHRNEAEQNAALANGTSTKRWPHSKHNRLPSVAVDIAPYPIDWNNVERFRYLAGYVLGVADAMGVRMRAGVDWNENFDPKDERFIDGPHLELVQP